MIPLSLFLRSRRSLATLVLVAAACGTESSTNSNPPATASPSDGGQSGQDPSPGGTTGQSPEGGQPAMPEGEGGTPGAEGGAGAGAGGSGGVANTGGGGGGDVSQAGAGGSGGAGGEPPVPPTQVPPEGLDKPNILFVIVDDQSPFDLKTYNERSVLDTPTIDKLAEDGMVIDGAYHMGAMVGAVCTPSRHMVMSGRTVWHVAARRDNPGPNLVPPNLVNNTMGALFERNGYATMRTSKLGNTYGPAGERFGVNRVGDWTETTKPSGSAWHADQVLDYLDARNREPKEGRKPFLIYYGFTHPHDPRNGTPELLEKYGATNHTDKGAPPNPTDKAPKVPVNWLPEHPFDHGHANLRDEVDVSGVWTRRDEKTIRNEMGREFACVENIDRQLARVMAKIDPDELEKTYIFYTSDHGIAIGRHGLQGKQNLYEHSWRVPMIVHGPGITGETRAQGNVYLTDVLATLADLAGIEPPDTNEGISFVPVLENREKIVRDKLYGVYAGGSKPGIRSLRKGDWKLIKWDVNNGAVRRTQLFNLAENPHEFIDQHQAAMVWGATGMQPTANQKNLADDPNFADKRAELEADLKSEMERLDDPHTLWDQ